MRFNLFLFGFCLGNSGGFADSNKCCYILLTFFVKGKCSNEINAGEKTRNCP